MVVDFRLSSRHNDGKGRIPLRTMQFRNLYYYNRSLCDVCLPVIGVLQLSLAIGQLHFWLSQSHTAGRLNIIPQSTRVFAKIRNELLKIYVLVTFVGLYGL